MLEDVGILLDLSFVACTFFPDSFKLKTSFDRLFCLTRKDNESPLFNRSIGNE